VHNVVRSDEYDAAATRHWKNRAGEDRRGQDRTEQDRTVQQNRMDAGTCVRVAEMVYAWMCCGDIKHIQASNFLRFHALHLTVCLCMCVCVTCCTSPSPARVSLSCSLRLMHLVRESRSLTVAEMDGKEKKRPRHEDR
jgi:hypothetical protein